MLNSFPSPIARIGCSGNSFSFLGCYKLVFHAFPLKSVPLYVHGINWCCCILTWRHLERRTAYDRGLSLS